MYKITKVTSSPSLSKNTRNVIQGRIQLPIAAKTKNYSGASEEWTDLHTLSVSNEEWDDTETLSGKEFDSISEDGYSPVEQLRCAEFSRSDRLVNPSSKLLDFDSDEFEKVIPLAASTRIFSEATFSEEEIDIPLQIPAETENCSFVEFIIESSIMKYDTSNVGSRSSCEIIGCVSKECGPLKANSRSSRNVRSSNKECGTSNANSRSSRNISGSSKDCGTSNADSQNSLNVSGTSTVYVTSDVVSENLLNGSTVERDLQEDSICKANSFFNSLKLSRKKLRNIQRSRQDSSSNPKLHNTVSRSLKDISNHKLPEGTFVTDRTTSALGKQNAVLSVSTKRGTKRGKRSKVLPAHLQDVPICCLSNNEVGCRPFKLMKPTYRSDIPLDVICFLK